jgi:hypothetical protein
MSAENRFINELLELSNIINEIILYFDKTSILVIKYQLLAINLLALGQSLVVALNGSNIHKQRLPFNAVICGYPQGAPLPWR